MAGNQVSDSEEWEDVVFLRKEVDQLLFTFSWITWGADKAVAFAVGISCFLEDHEKAQ